MVLVDYDGGKKQIEELFRLISVSNQNKSQFLTPKVKDFFREAVNYFFPQNKLMFYLLTMDNENIAVLFGFYHNNSALLYNSGFDPRFANFSPGLVLNAHAIRKSIEKGINQYDFLRGSERYKYDLGGVDRKLYKIFI
ncbi:MAG: hypothetical protein UT63_C0016G0001 [Candidatus Gottesmanbacteria bacterium GW2011_GWC2_39_8]|uniref:BioF2-like acetyltransferase domain-containing protein n=1 Tax=Candidatus Gottesmanbacteria bacterium GW2011_GWC2_39_8 TaxID=1618450 RepID=A0A0G0T6I7_9BACT|nr:MAG: hypothetical protein UT63_C0016G0001 [Candidatus Gottesmanbacteria bacterium GW2011_GWC2_39_8]